VGVGLFFSLALVAFIAFFLAGFLRQKIKQRRRAHIRRQPMSSGWVEILNQNVPLYSCLPSELKPDLEANIGVFLDEKEFHGRGGQEITDEVRVTVAGNACMLLLNRPNNCFPNFRTILVYPQTYRASELHRAGPVVTSGASHRAGESWHRGPVVLAWSDVLYGSKVRGDGFNVVLHEFAHKLDEGTPSAGVPVLQSAEEYTEWARVFSRDYQIFLEEIRSHPDETIDGYGATSPAEFFAVCTESFFEKPRLMKKDWPGLYQQLAKFYAVDPVSW
jgi:MtfA peptidase